MVFGNADPESSGTGVLFSRNPLTGSPEPFGEWLAGFTVGLLALGATLSSCAVPFYWQAIGGQWELLRKRTPIEEVLSDPHQGEHVKAALGKVPTIRRFAVEELLDDLPRGPVDPHVLAHVRRRVDQVLAHDSEPVFA